VLSLTCVNAGPDAGWHFLSINDREGGNTKTQHCIIIMFCFQCEQTSKGTGCTDFAVCGKTESTAVLQDLLVHAAKGIAQYSHRARLLGATDAALDRFLLEALFITVTNVNFDDAAIEKTIRRAIVLREQAKSLYQDAARKAGIAVEEVRGPSTWSPARTTEALVAHSAHPVAPWYPQHPLGTDAARVRHAECAEGAE
jgi:hypothetical protein